MGSPTIVQHKSVFASGVASGSGVTATFGSAVTAGNMILALVGTAHDASNNAITINTPTMTGETFTTWTGAPNAGSAGNGQTGVFARNSATGGQTAVTVTVTFAAGTNPDIHLHIIEINGQAASPRDAQGNTESTTLSVSTSGSTATANDLVIGFFYDDANNRALTVGGGYSQVELSSNSTGGDAGLSESKSVSATGTQTATAGGNVGDTVEQSIVCIAGTASGGVTIVVDSPEEIQQTGITLSRDVLLDDITRVPTPPFVIEEDGLYPRNLDWRALYHEDSEMASAKSPIPPFAIQDEVSDRWTGTPILYDEEFWSNTAPKPPFAIQEEFGDFWVEKRQVFHDDTDTQSLFPIIINVVVPLMGWDDEMQQMYGMTGLSSLIAHDELINAILPPPVLTSFVWVSPRGHHSRGNQ